MYGEEVCKVTECSMWGMWAVWNIHPCFDQCCKNAVGVYRSSEGCKPEMNVNKVMLLPYYWDAHWHTGFWMSHLNHDETHKVGRWVFLNKGPLNCFSEWLWREPGMCSLTRSNLWPGSYGLKKNYLKHQDSPWFLHALFKQILLSLISTIFLVLGFYRRITVLFIKTIIKIFFLGKVSRTAMLINK